MSPFSPASSILLASKSRRVTGVCGVCVRVDMFTHVCTYRQDVLRADFPFTKMFPLNKQAPREADIPLRG